MRTYLYLFIFVIATSVLTSCQVQPDLNPTAAYVGTYTCTLVNRTTRLTETAESVETKKYTGKVTQTAERSVELTLTPTQGDGALTIPLLLTDEAFVVPQFVTSTNYTAAGTTNYLSSYYVGSGKLQNQTLDVALNAASYRIVGATGNQVQISNSDLDCNCLKKQSEY